jgi:hypothetical protein
MLATRLRTLGFNIRRLDQHKGKLMRSGIAISLRHQHAHIEDAVLIYTSQHCAVYLLANTHAAALSFVKLKFEGARCVRSASTDLNPAIGIHPTELGVSIIVELTDSTCPLKQTKPIRMQIQRAGPEDGIT